MTLLNKKALAAAAITCALATLSACGGGGGGGGASGGAVGIPPTSNASMASAPSGQTKDTLTAQEAPVKECSVSLYGDSILRGSYLHHGISVTIPEPPAATLRRIRPAYNVIDNSRDGNSVLLDLHRFLNSSFDTRFVVIEYGINDAGHGFIYEEPLRSMVRRVKATGREPIVTGLSRTTDELSNRIEYNAAARRVAEQEGALFADWDSVRFDKSEMMDRVHPAQPYSTRLAERIVEVLDKAAPECAR